MSDETDRRAWAEPDTSVGASTQLHVLKYTDAYSLALSGLVDGLDVLELGVGTGVLTKLLFCAGARTVLGYEILPGVCDVTHHGFTLKIADYTESKLDVDGRCLVANPAYSTLPFIVKEVLPKISNAILMIPERCVDDFYALGFRSLFSLQGDAFEPASDGQHVVVMRGFPPRFVDLHDACMRLRSDSVVERVWELAGLLPKAALCGLGGFPFRQRNRIDYSDWKTDSARHARMLMDLSDPRPLLRWCGDDVTVSRLRSHITDALGLSAVLTYANRKSKSLEALGKICVDRKETWAYHWISATIVFADHPPEVHLSFARDGRFRLGWPLEKTFTGAVFTASAGLHEWMKFLAHADDGSFDAPTRAAMGDAWHALKGILP